MIKKKENLNNENKNQMNYNNSQKSEKNLDEKTQKNNLKSTAYKEGFYKLLSVTKKLFYNSRKKNFEIIKVRNEELKKYIKQYKVIKKLLRLYKHKQDYCCKTILKNWISKLKSSKKS